MTTKNDEEKYILEPTDEELAEYSIMAGIMSCSEFDDYCDAFQRKHYGKIVYTREEREKRDHMSIDEWNAEAIKEIFMED